MRDPLNQSREKFPAREAALTDPELVPSKLRIPVPPAKLTVFREMEPPLKLVIPPEPLKPAFPKFPKDVKAPPLIVKVPPVLKTLSVETVTDPLSKFKFPPLLILSKLSPPPPGTATPKVPPSMVKV